MKKNTNSADERKDLHMSSLYWLLTCLHYLSGIGGLIASVVMATSSEQETKIDAAVTAVLCIIIFAAFHPDNKYKKLETGWRILDKKLNRYP